MQTIKVFIYSYKNKNLIDQVKDLTKKASGNNKIKYYVCDQNNLDREFFFKEVADVVYSFVRWDDYKSITYYRNITIFNKDSSKYFMEIDPNIEMSDNWDDYLLENIKDNVIISGSGSVKISLSDGKIFSEVTENNEISKSNYLNIDLLFCKLKDAMLLNDMHYLKKYGQDLLGSLIYLSKGFEIQSLPSNKYIKRKQENDETYIPYSVFHNYNRLVSTIKNNLYDLDIFKLIHGVDLLDLKYKPYEINDVGYLGYRVNLDELNVPRFLSGYRGIVIL